jgi:hypothetical protein
VAKFDLALVRAAPDAIMMEEDETGERFHAEESGSSYRLAFR